MSSVLGVVLFAYCTQCVLAAPGLRRKRHFISVEGSPLQKADSATVVDVKTLSKKIAYHSDTESLGRSHDILDKTPNTSNNGVINEANDANSKSTPRNLDAFDRMEEDELREFVLRGLLDEDMSMSMSMSMWTDVSMSMTDHYYTPSPPTDSSPTSPTDSSPSVNVPATPPMSSPPSTPDVTAPTLGSLTNAPVPAPLTSAPVPTPVGMPPGTPSEMISATGIPFVPTDVATTSIPVVTGVTTIPVVVPTTDAPTTAPIAATLPVDTTVVPVLPAATDAPTLASTPEATEAVTDALTEAPPTPAPTDVMTSMPTPGQTEAMATEMPTVGSGQDLTGTDDSSQPDETMVPSLTDGDGSDGAGTDIATESPSLTITDDAGGANGGCESLDRTDAIFFILFDLTDPNLLDNPLTPYGQAFRWIWLSDPARLDPCDSATFRQRYALSLFYFATTGDDWDTNTGWLSEEHECTWYGVECNEAKEVTGLDLGMFFFYRTT